MIYERKKISKLNFIKINFLKNASNRYSSENKTKTAVWQKLLEKLISDKEQCSKYVKKNSYNLTVRRETTSLKVGRISECHKKDKQIAYKHMKRCSISYAIKESQIKVRHLYTSIKMGEAQNTNNQILMRVWRTGTRMDCWWE